MLRNKLILTATGFLVGVAMTTATIGMTAQPVVANQTEEVDRADHAYMIAQKANVAATVFQLDKTGLHDIDVKASEGEILPGALGAVRHARIAANATAWPAELMPMATDLVEHMKMLEEAIRTEDAAQVAEPASMVHDKAHDLSAAVYTWLDTGEAPAEGGHGH